MRYKNAQARFCKDRCRNYARREAIRGAVPKRLTEIDRWVRRDAAKRPLAVSGGMASSTDSATWSSYEAARNSERGTGLGFVLNGDGIACVDLDGVLVDGALDPRATEFLASLDSFYVEVSPSGSGIHAWVDGGSPDGRKVFTLDNGLKVEWYSDARYLTVTGKRFFM